MTDDEEWPTLTCPSCEDVFPYPGGNVVVCERCGAQVQPRSPGAGPFLLDSNAYDPLVDDPEVVAARRRGVPVRADRAADDPRPVRRACEMPDTERLSLAASIPFVIVATYGMILGSASSER